MSVTLDLLDGIARTAATAGLVTYRSDDSKYLASETAVGFAVMPQDPDRCVVLTAYTLGDNAAMPLASVRVQFRFRGLPNRADDTWALRDGFYTLFQSATDKTYGSVHVVQFLRSSSIPMGVDENGRWIESDNYALDVDMPATANRP